MTLRHVPCLAFALTVAALAPAQQAPTFSSKVEAVRIDVLVTEKGSPARGLRPGDFEVFDNGVRQRVDLAIFEQLPLNIVLTLDMSSSVIGERLDQLRAAARGTLDGLKKEDRAALVVFSHQVAVTTGLTPDVGRVRAALERAQPFGDTSLVDATYAGLMIGESDVGRSLVMVFSDGVDTTSWLAPHRVSEVAKRSDAVVYGVSAQGSSRAEFLRDMAAETGGRLIEVKSTGDLTSTFLAILDEFRQRYLVSYSPSGVSKDGWHTIEVRVKGRNATVKARPGYFAGS